MDGMVFKKSKIQEIIDKNPSQALDFYVDALYTMSTTFIEFREEHELSQKELASILGVSQVMVSKFESGSYNFSLKEICTVLSKIGKKLHTVKKEDEIKIILDYSLTEKAFNLKPAQNCFSKRRFLSEYDNTISSSDNAVQRAV